MPKEWTSWDYTPGGEPIARLLLDTDGMPQVLWMPVFLTPAVQVSVEFSMFYAISDLFSKAKIFNDLIEFGTSVKSGLSTKGGADSSGRNSHYRKAPGEITGCINVALWHAIGHEVSRWGVQRV